LWLTLESGRIGIAAECRNRPGSNVVCDRLFRGRSATDERIAAMPELAEERERPLSLLIAARR
jgi:hypothetical protein